MTIIMVTILHIEFMAIVITVDKLTSQDIIHFDVNCFIVAKI